MTVSEIINIVLVALTIISTAIGYYFKVKQTITNKINGLINEAEDTDAIGAEKMEKVVNDLYYFVPVPYRGVLNKDVIQKMVQFAFDKIEAYAQKQVEKNSDK